MTAFLITSSIVGLLFIFMDNYPFKKKQKKEEKKKTPKEIWEQMEEKEDEKAIANGEWEMLEQNSSLYYILRGSTRMIGKKKGSGLYRGKDCIHYNGVTYIIIHWLKKTDEKIINEIKRKQREEAKEKARIEQQEEDKKYQALINEKLKIKPLDEDLQKTFDRVSKIIKLGKEIEEKTKQINLLRKQ